MFTRPPLFAELIIGVVLADIQRILIPTPGVGNCLRIVKLGAEINRTTTGVVDVTFSPTVALTPILLRALAMSYAGVPYYDHEVPAPGVQLAVNNGLQVQEAASLAVGFLVVWAYYFIDPVT